MDVEIALKFVEDLLIRKFARTLTNNEKVIFRGAWQGLTYSNMMGQANICMDESEFRRIGGGLWSSIASLFNRPVTKSTFRGIVEQQWQLCDKHSSVEPQIDTEDDPQKFNLLKSPNFVGRKKAIADLDTLIKEGENCILIQSPGGVGKTTLAERYLEQKFKKPPLRFDIGKESQNINSAETWIQQNLRKLEEEPGHEFLVSCDRLRTKLQSESLGILVDNLEPALNEKGQFIENHRNYVELLRVLCDRFVQSITLITSRERICENLDIALYMLEKLSIEAWQEYFSLKNIACGSSIFEAIYEAYQGNALAMHVLRERILIDFDGNIEEYWEFYSTIEGICVESRIKNLVSEQFERLEKIDTVAYDLLCRMGCFRYQDVPTVPRDGLLHLLWNSSQKEGIKAIQALCDRGLLDRINREYKLHPLIREEAIDRLRNNGRNWELANRKAAEFWTKSITLVETRQEGKKLLEAFHHFAAIQDWKLASKFLLQHKPQTKNTEFLSQLRNLGYIVESIEIIKLVLRNNHSLDQQTLAELNSTLGGFYTINGNLKQAISSYEKSLKLWKQAKIKHEHDEENFNFCVDTKGGIAFIYLKIADYSKAINLFESILLDQIDWKILYIYMYCCLGFLYYSSGNNLKARERVNHAINLISNLKDSDFENFTWSKIYGFYYLGRYFIMTNNLDKAQSILKKLYTFSEKNSYPQAKGLFLDAMAEIRMKNNHLSSAIETYHEAIQIFKQINAKCELAEAYHKIALAYKRLDNYSIDSQRYFSKAIDLWQAIDAPKQIQRIYQSMDSF